MKSVITLPEAKAIFPQLYKSVDSSLVVLFTDVFIGTIVMEGSDCSSKLGEYSESWVDCTDTDEWELFTGSVTLSN